MDSTHYVGDGCPGGHHDPLCRAQHMDVATEWDDLGGCDCPVIARVRADERERNGEMNRIVGRDYRERLRAQVEALHGRAPSTYWDDALDEVLALLDGAQ